MAIFLNAEHSSDYIILLNNAISRNESYMRTINYKCSDYKFNFYSCLKAIELYHYLLKNQKNNIIRSVYPNGMTSCILYPDYDNVIRLNFIHKMMVDEDLSAASAMKKYKKELAAELQAQQYQDK